MSASSFGSYPRGAIRVLEETQGITAVCLEGEFDLVNVSPLRDQIDQALESGNDLVLDLSQTTFIDSRVIRLLFDSARAAYARNQTIVLQLGTAPIVERALEICGIECVLPRAHTRDEAVQIIQRTTTIRPAAMDVNHRVANAKGATESQRIQA